MVSYGTFTRIVLTCFFSSGDRDDNDKLSNRVRKFYKKQDELIDSFEQLHEQNADDTERETNRLTKQKRRIDWMIRLTLIFNCVSK